MDAPTPDDIDDELDDEATGPLIDLFDVDVPVVNEVSYKRPLPLVKPSRRSECIDMPRPCPFVSCRYHLYLDVKEDGSLKINFPDREPWEMAATCSLDLASDGPRTLDIIGGLMGVSKERARQLERTGLNKVGFKFSAEDVD